MKVAFVIGHTELDGGAFSKHFGDSEWGFWSDFAEEHLKEYEVFTHNRNVYSYTKRQKLMSVATKSFDLVIELHFNSANGKAHGAECLYYHKNELTKDVSKKFSKLCSSYMGYRDRGTKGRDKSQRGGGFLYYQKPAALIAECFFGDNEKDCKRFDAKKFKKVLEETIEYFAELKEKE